ncbi:hypothetical protein ACIQPR_49055 [Streptomyces sp. NPDC091280]|uniref:hypothetical protein n=1 Tax=Streptomyces sp. NPDC091280 TaxID=3365984 RepID=UPI00380F6C74
MQIVPEVLPRRRVGRVARGVPRDEVAMRIGGGREDQRGAQSVGGLREGQAAVVGVSDVQDVQGARDRAEQPGPAR